MARRHSRAGLSIHRCYSVDEAARVAGVCRATVRRWIKTGLPVIDDRRPALISGRELSTFLEARRKRRKRKCAANEFYCLSCKEPRQAAFGDAEIVSRSRSTANVRALCAQCGALMHKRISLKMLPPLSEIAGLRVQQGHKDLSGSADPCSNIHFLHASRSYG